jgi:hypothetical protein
MCRCVCVSSSTFMTNSLLINGAVSTEEVTNLKKWGCCALWTESDKTGNGRCLFHVGIIYQKTRKHRDTPATRRDLNKLKGLARQRTSFERLCACTVTCPREPISFRQLVYKVFSYFKKGARPAFPNHGGLQLNWFPPKSQRPSAKAITILLGSNPREPSNENPFHKGHVAWWDNLPPVATTPSLKTSRTSAAINTPLA